MNTFAAHTHTCSGSPSTPRPAAVAALTRLSAKLIPALIATLGLSVAGWGYQLVPATPVPGAVRTARLPNGATMKFVWIEPGTRTAEDPEPQADRNDQGGPQQEATPTRGYYLAQSAVTQAQWQAVMGMRPWTQRESEPNSDDPPVVRVSWRAVQAFVTALNRAAGEVIYRLPTESEWEYAYRTGVDGQYAQEREAAMPPVSARRSDAWGLYDMRGNQPEWIQDCYGNRRGGEPDEPLRGAMGARCLLPGNSLYGDAPITGAAVCASTSPEDRGVSLGIRLVMIRQPSSSATAWR